METALEKNKTTEYNKKPKEKKEITISEWDKEVVSQLLNENIDLLLSKRSNYKSVVQIAGMFRMTQPNFRKKCFSDPELGNLLHVFTGLANEDIFNKAIQKGAISSAVETYLKDELQAFSGMGLEQQITWVIDNPKPVDIDGNEFELVVDNEVDESEPQKLLWEVDNGSEE